MFAAPNARRRRRIAEFALPLLALAGIAMASYHIAGTLERQRQQQLAAETRILAGQLRLRLEARIDVFTAVVDHLAREWRSGDVADLATFRSEADSLRGEFPGLNAFHWIDAAGRARRLAPEPTASVEATPLPLASAVSIAVKALADSRASGRATRTPVLRRGESLGFFIVRSTDSTDGLGGALAAEIRVRALLDECLGDPELRERFRFDFHEPGTGIIYEHRVGAQPHAWRHQIALPVRVVDRDWKLEIAPGAALAAGTGIGAQAPLLGTGALLGLTLAVLLHLRLVRQRHFRESATRAHRLLRWSRELQRATHLPELLEVVRVEVRRLLEFENVWIHLDDPARPGHWRLLGSAGPMAEAISKTLGSHEFPAGALPAAAEAPVVVADARSDSRAAPAMVDRLGSRSLVSVALVLMDEHRGILSTGSFDPDPCRSPSRAELQQLSGMATHVAVAVSRVLLLEERRRTEAEREKVEAQLQRHQKLNSLGLLAGGVAHDFNNLLAAILGNTDLALQELPAGSANRRLLEDVLRSAERATELCQQLLAYAGQGRLQARPVDLSSLVQELVHLLEGAVSKHAEIKLDLARDLPPVSVDATQVRQVIMNLITNASDAIGSQAGSIHVRTGIDHCGPDSLGTSYLDDDLPGGLYVFAEISDTGCGMDESDVGRIFDPFFTTKIEGHGLGLATALGVVRRHRGSLKVYSEPGRGSCFKILLPAAEQPAAAEVDKPATDPNWRGSGTALVVDDDEAVLRLARRILEKLGFRVFTACGGVEALEIFRRESDKVDLVLLDMTMPMMSGEETFRALLKIRRDVPVLLSSGYGEIDARTRFREPGLAGFVQKPYRISTLAAKVREALGR